MFLKQIEVSRFKKLKNFKLIFPESQILDMENKRNMKLSVIIGENGTAKTTIFQFLLNSFREGKLSNEIEDYEIKYSIDNQDIVKRKYGFFEGINPSRIVVSSYTPFDKLIINNQQDIEGILLKATNTKGIKNIVSRVVKKYSLGKTQDVHSILNYVGYSEEEILFEFSNHKLNNISYSISDIQRKLASTKNKDFNIFKVDFKKSIMNKAEYYDSILEEFSLELKYEAGARIRKKMTIKERMENMTRFSYNRKIASIDSVKIEHYALEVTFILMKFKLLESMSKKYSTNYKGGERKLLPLAALKHYPGGNNQLNEDLEFLEYFSIDLWNDAWFTNSVEMVPLSMFSSGELSTFIRFFDLLEFVNDNSLVLIDEPETHLHPKWIRDYIKTLIQLLGDKKCHVIIATHSPLIVSDIKHDNIIGLKKNKTGEIEQFTIKEETVGMSYETVLEEVFGVPEKEGEMIHEYEKMIIHLLEKGETEKAVKIFSQLADTETTFQLYLKLEEYYKRIDS